MKKHVVFIALCAFLLFRYIHGIDSVPFVAPHSSEVVIKKPEPKVVLEDGYPRIPLRTEAGRTVVPVCTSFSEKGDSDIVGHQMLAGMRAYLRGYRHFLREDEPEDGDNADEFIIEHKSNNQHVGDKGLAKIEKMIKKIPLMLGLVSSENMLSISPLIKDKKLALLFPNEGSPLIRQWTYDNVIYFRPSYEKELKALVKYAYDVKHKTKIAIFYEASKWGENLLKTLEHILDDYDVEVVATASYPQGTAEVEDALKAIAQGKEKPNAIFFLAQPRPALQFASNAINVGLHECLLVGLSHLYVIQKLLKKAQGLDMVVTSVVPQAQFCNFEIAREYRSVMKSFLSFRSDSPVYFEACLKELADDELPITIKNVLEKLRSFRGTTFKGLLLNGDEENTLSASVWINPGSKRRWLLYTK